MGDKFKLLRVLHICHSVLKCNHCFSQNIIFSNSNITLKPKLQLSCFSKQNLMSEPTASSKSNVSCSSSKSLPVVTQLNSPEFFSIYSDELKQLQKIFTENHYELRMCGGAVRDLLLGNKPKDIDLATTATPEQMISIFRKLNIRLVNESGWGHGTVTCRLEEKNFEITTLRIDRVTDGRHATVEYTTDWQIDAARRDLTFNSLFLTFEGRVIDYFNGVEDLKNRHVKFVGNAERRIHEDYLRILRYFRFFGRIADSNSKFDESTVTTISQNVSGLKQISGERILMELMLIFTGNHVVSIVKMMKTCGLFEVVGLPNDADMDEFERIYNKSKHLSPYYMTYVTALLSNENDLNTFRSRAKLSNMDLNIARFILNNRNKNFSGCDKLALYTDIVVDYHREFFRKGSNILDFFLEFLKYRGDIKALNHFSNFIVPRFPVSGKTIKEKTGLKGKIIGKIINVLFEHWRDSRYTLNESELIEKLDDEMISRLNS